MKLEDFPEIKKGMIAEIGYVEPRLVKNDNPINPHGVDKYVYAYVDEPKFLLFYVGEIIYLEEITDFSGESSPGFKRVDKETASSQKGIYTALKVYKGKYRGELPSYDSVNINMEAIVSFKPLEYIQPRK